MNMERNEQPRSVLLIGVPDAGKTNFLSRLWLTLDAGKGVLAKAELPADLDYLKAGADHLLKGEFAPHTPQDVHDKTEIRVKSTSAVDKFRGTLVVPDLPGEQILSVFRTRRWSSEWEDKILPGCACLLFVRVDSNELIVPLDWNPWTIATSSASAAIMPIRVRPLQKGSDIWSGAPRLPTPSRRYGWTWGRCTEQ